MAERMKITYSTMSADNEELQSAFDEAFAKVRASMLGVEVPMFIGGEQVLATRVSRFERQPGGVQLDFVQVLSPERSREATFFVPLEAP